MSEFKEMRVKFCRQCGRATKFIIPAGDNRPRDVCSNPDCQLIHYQNPKIVVGCLVIYKEKILLCRRAIELGYGLVWKMLNLPATELCEKLWKKPE